MTITPASYPQIRHLASRAAREHVAITDTRETAWWAARSTFGRVVGCAGVIRTSTVARVKGVYLLPMYRGEGDGRKLMDVAVAAADATGLELEVLAWRPEGWKRYGLEVIGERPNGAVVMRRGNG